MQFTVEDVVLDFLSDGKPKKIVELAEEMKIPEESKVIFGCILYRMYISGQAFINENNATIGLRPPFELSAILRETIPLTSSKKVFMN